MGPLPAAGQWVRLQIPAKQVGLEGSTVKGMAFSAYGGRVTWDASGKGTANASTAWLQPKVTPSRSAVSIAWDSSIGRTYRVSYKNSLTESNWIVLNSITASGVRSSLVDSNGISRPQRFYMVAAAD